MSTLVHGVVYMTVHEAKNLPQRETLGSKVSGFFKGMVGQDNDKDFVGTYVKIKVGDFQVGKTRTINDVPDELNPKWRERFRSDLAHETDDLAFYVRGDDLGNDCYLGILKLSGEDIMSNPENPVEWRILSYQDELPFARDPEWFPLVDKDGQLNGAFLKLTIVFHPAALLKDKSSLVDTYFSKHKGCKMTCYQDAETPHSQLFDSISYTDGSTYEAACAWRDIFAAINNAQHFIYITGWSVWTDLVLVRDEGEEEIKLGDLLVQKANDGVRVLGLVWNEKASTDCTPGLMGTHDEETGQFFAETEADIELVYRKKDRRHQIIDAIYSTCYSHHQKCVIVDAEHPEDEEKRRVIAFVGGLDLAQGRYDTPEHPLFSTLQSAHKSDFYQNCVTVPAEHGPREPWHDIHCKVEGPVAIDVLINFEERWQKQAPSEKKSRLLDIRGGESFDINCKAPCEEEESWDCQLFRSITADSVYFNEELFDRLTKKAGAPTDDSIHRAYCHHIRRAEKYIYIENQYFLGSAYAWPHDSKPKAHHLIPFEITNRIIEKIKEGERFCVYVVIPMFPEGVPNSKAVQEILHWQKNTIEMMYKRIKIAIDNNGLDTTPQDYLNIYCLSKRESTEPDLPEADPDSVEGNLRQTRRFMIYVHSKMMIVDDQYIIVGSANINQRSMGGTRDTEIAVGGMQPAHVYDGESLPKGKVHGFRMALWAEHCGTVEECFEDPSSEECIQRVNEIASGNWEIYSGEETGDTNGYITKYPYDIGEDGTISALEGYEQFCDFDSASAVLGNPSNMLPNKLTT